MSAHERNWAGNLAYRAARIHRPRSLDELRATVRGSSSLRALGSRHSFNRIADTPGDLVSLEALNRVVALDRERGTVTVQAGIKYGDLCAFLHAEGFALHNLASLPHISVAGACATATHGSGERNGNLATAVTAIELVAADGELVSLARERDGEAFLGAVVSLGALGVAASVTLAIEPAFAVQQEVYVGLPAARLEDSFDAIVASAYSVSLFTDWQGDTVSEVWLKRRLPGGAALPVAGELFGAALAPGPLHPIAALSAENCTVQGGVPGPWHQRLPHFRMEFTPSSGDELQTEYFVPRPHAVAAMRAVAALREQLAPLLMISEVRTIAADELWMSPCYRQACVGLHFTWRPDEPGVLGLLPALEAQLAPFEPRPHWGKLFTMPAAQLQPHYPRLADFRALAQQYDPRGKFRNAFIDSYIFA
ncbi:MAG TPA: FAD-binding protein [Kouleothrix sp.]|uniref:FAD-binding protein n=1 Tax=Kouleothrix sp. TaxID=2779161 RepID=UPI002D121BCC|nr:FAD-binding protein [Kouleothrix sp.]HRC76619.1 FAD-binding protein [Kouleothrix sp.]